MPFDSSGTFQPLPPPTFPAITGNTVRSDYFNAILNDLMAGLTTTFRTPNVVVPALTTVVLTVPGQYATIQAAIAAVASWQIFGTVQILVSDGIYVPTTSINLRHPFGQNIQLIGNPGNPSNCVLRPASPPTFDLFVANGLAFGKISGFLLDLGTKAASANNASAVLAVNGGTIAEVSNLVINNWYYQIAAREGGSQIYAHDCTLTNGGDVAVWGFSGGCVTCNNITVSGTVDTPNSLGFGFQAEYGGVVEATNCTASTCLRAGFAALSNGTGRYYGCNSNLNVGSGFLAQAGGMIEANGGSSINNTRYGQEFFGSGTCTGLAANTGNALGVDNGALYFDQGPLGARLAGNGNIRIDSNSASSIFFNSSNGLNFAVLDAGSAKNMNGQVQAFGSGIVFGAGGTTTNIDVSLNGQGTGFTFLGANRANFLRVNGQVAGSAPQLRAEGVDTDIDLFLGGKGAGFVRFGTYTATGDVACNGSVSIKDAAGNVRKLMTTA